ncbi:MAG: RDD family protein [Clostridia bacterium]|jgi:uncharacterized RDD family membrane protein YckC|nr:RDD family protein [Clostridia bacterium]
MTAEDNRQNIEIEANSKPNLLKRIVSDGFDITLLFMAFMLLTYIVLATPLADVYHGHADRYREIFEETKKVAGDDEEKLREMLIENEEYKNEFFAANLHSFLLKALAALIAELILFLAVPLMSRTRATLGKMLTGLVVFSEKRQNRASWYQILGKFVFIYIIDSLSLYLWTGIYTFLLVPVIRFIVMMLNRKDKTVLDYVTSTMVIEKMSYSPAN